MGQKREGTMAHIAVIAQAQGCSRDRVWPQEAQSFDYLLKHDAVRHEQHRSAALEALLVLNVSACLGSLFDVSWVLDDIHSLLTSSADSNGLRHLHCPTAIHLSIHIVPRHTKRCCRKKSAKAQANTPRGWPRGWSPTGQTCAELQIAAQNQN